jgi:hypothetical protein
LVAVYAYPWHIVEAACPHPAFRLARGDPHALPADADYILLHINHTLRAGWSTWFSGPLPDDPAGSIFWDPLDPAWLALNYRQVYTVERAFGLQMASVWQRK